MPVVLYYGTLGSFGELKSSQDFSKILMSGPLSTHLETESLGVGPGHWNFFKKLSVVLGHREAEKQGKRWP